MGPAETKERGEGASRPQDLFPSLLVPPLSPAVPDAQLAHSQPWCSWRSSTPHSHRPRLASPGRALLLALAPGLTGRLCLGAILRSVRSSLRWLVDRGGNGLSVIGGIGLGLRTTRR